MKHIKLIVALLFTPLVGLTAAESPKPNIVYILADDLGYGDVQCLNPERGKIKTPHLDKLASQGMTFTDAHSGSSVCTPTRYGVLTGRYAWRTRLQNSVLDGYVEPLIAADRLTVPGLLKQSGYHTAIIGKWHLGYTIEGADKKGGAKGKRKGALEGAPLGAITHDGPVTRGFDEFFGFHHARMMKSVFENDRVAQIIEPMDILPALVKRSTDHIAARAKTGQPFFLYLPLNSPHTPIVPAKEWRGKSGLGDYADFVMQTDWAVGEVLAALDKAGIADNTLVVFTSDNGCSKAANITGLEKQDHYPSADLRGSKADIWEGGHRVPFIVRWPAKIKAGTKSAQLICHTDLMATCANILNTKLPDTAGEDSVSILPALLDTDKSPLHETVVHHSINGSFAIRQANMKLTLCADSGGWSAPKPGSKEAKDLPKTQLYDLSMDKAEAKNLQAERPEQVARLTKLLEQIIADGRSTPGVKQANDVPIQIRKKSGKTIEE
jgi:arylsulfatase A